MNGLMGSQTAGQTMKTSPVLAQIENQVGVINRLDEVLDNLRMRLGSVISPQLAPPGVSKNGLREEAPVSMNLGDSINRNNNRLEGIIAFAQDLTARLEI